MNQNAALELQGIDVVVPDGTGRPLLNWKEADKAPWGVIMMFGGGLALAADRDRHLTVA